MRIKQKTNKTIKLLALFAMALVVGGGVSYAIAANSTGTVTVTDEIPRITNVVFPGAVDPKTPATLTLTIEYGQGLSSGDELFIFFYADGYPADTSASSINPDNVESGNSTFAYWANGFNKGFEYYGPDVNNFVQPDPATLPIEDGSDINLGLDLTQPALATYGTWHLLIKLKYTKPDTSTGQIEYADTFQVNGYMEVAIDYASFDFGSVEQGQARIGIQTPTSGYLNVTVTANVAYFVQLSGTDPDDGDGHSFGVSNIVQNSVNDADGATALSSTLADLLGLGSQPKGEATHQVYLWVSIPIDQVTATYTFTLSVVGVAA